METILVIVLAVISIVLIDRGRKLGQKKIWGPITDRINNDTLRICKEVQEEGQKNYKLTLDAWCDVCGVDFDISLSREDFVKLKQLYLDNPDLRADFNLLADYDSDLYREIYWTGMEKLDHELKDRPHGELYLGWPKSFEEQLKNLK